MLNFLTPEKLLAELEERFPPPFNGPEDKIQHIMYNAGEQNIIRWIRQRINDEEKY